MNALRRALLSFAAMSALAGASAGVTAQPADAAADYPARMIRVVVPYSPGGGTDTVARTVVSRLSKILGRPLVVENRPGANTGIGAELVARSQPDGHTLMFTNDATFVLNPLLFTSLSYDMARDFTPVATVAYLNLTLTASSTLPVSNFAELVAWTRANSGKISYGSYGVGSQAHVMGETFKRLTGTDIAHVPYKGSAPALADVIGGQVVFTFPAIASIQGFLKADRVKALAISGDARSPLLPEVPTFKELGYADLDIGAWYAFFAPAATPKAIVDKFNAAVATMLQDKAFVEEHLLSQGMLPMPLDAKATSERIAAESARMKSIVQASGVKVE